MTHWSIFQLTTSYTRVSGIFSSITVNVFIAKWFKTYFRETLKIWLQICDHIPKNRVDADFYQNQSMLKIWVPIQISSSTQINVLWSYWKFTWWFLRLNRRTWEKSRPRKEFEPVFGVQSTEMIQKTHGKYLFFGQFNHSEDGSLDLRNFYIYTIFLLVACLWTVGAKTCLVNYLNKCNKFVVSNMLSTSISLFFMLC